MRLRHVVDPKELVAALLAGGLRAEAVCRQLIAARRPLLRARFFAAGVAAQDIDDLVSETLTTVVSQIHRLRDPDRFDAWLYTIATSVLNQHWRSLHRSRELFAEPAAPALDEGGEDLDALAATIAGHADGAQADPATELCLRQQLERLRQEHGARHACLELLAMGYSSAEIAVHIGRSDGAARQFISQCCAVAMTYLQACLEAEVLLGRRRGAARAETGRTRKGKR